MSFEYEQEISTHPKVIDWICFFGGLGLCGLHDLYGRIVMSVWCGVPLTFKQPIDCYQFPKMTIMR